MFAIKSSSSRYGTYDCPKCAGWGREEEEGAEDGERKKSLLPHCTKWPMLYPLVTVTASFPHPTDKARA